MGKINMGRVILGGLLAGVVINIGESVLNIPILGDQWAEVMQKYGLQESPAVMTWYFVWGFLTGIVTVWLYAAIRPRFGAGPRTAIISGLAVWVIMWFLGWVGFVVNGMFPSGLMVTSLIWGFFEVPIAAVVGAWLYKEEGAPAAA